MTQKFRVKTSNGWEWREKEISLHNKTKQHFNKKTPKPKKILYEGAVSKRG